MRIIKRNYLDKMINVIGTPNIKVIIGAKHSGKSKLLESFNEYVKNNIKNSNVISINFSLLEFKELKDYRKLNEYIENKYINGMNNFVCIDEIKMCSNFEKVINTLYAKGKYDIYIAGLNEFLLNSDIDTLFNRKIFKINVFPVSVKEFI